MSNPLGKIGKSLLKFFKPVRVASPHEHPQEYVPPTLSKESKGFKLLRFRKKGTKADEDTVGMERPNRVPAENLPIVDEHQQISDKVPSHWLELVVSLLAACRRASSLMRRKIGLETYRRMIQSKGATKNQTVGSIIDTTPTIADLELSKKDEDEAA